MVEFSKSESYLFVINTALYSANRRLCYDNVICLDVEGERVKPIKVEATYVGWITVRAAPLRLLPTLTSKDAKWELKALHGCRFRTSLPLTNSAPSQDSKTLN